MTKTELDLVIANLVRKPDQGLEPAKVRGDPPAGAIGHTPTKSGFRHNFSKNCPQDLKMVQKDAPCDSLQSAARIRC